MNMKVLLLLTLTLLAAFSIIATVAATVNMPTSASFSTTKTMPVTISYEYVQPTGDPIDNPTAPG